jgi:hypothetical protein
MPATEYATAEFAGLTKIGAIPPKFAMSTCTTLLAIPAATPASTAFPPASKIFAAT